MSQKRESQTHLQRQEVLENAIQKHLQTILLQSQKIKEQTEELKKQAEEINQLTKANSKLKASISQELKSPQERFMEKCKKIVEDNYTNPNFSVEDWGNQMYMSRAQFFRKIKSGLGLTPLQYIRTYRLEKAKALLIENERNGSQVAYMVGFNSPNYFFKCFKEEYGITVGDFVKR